jgi:hypothetical protein
LAVLIGVGVCCIEQPTAGAAHPHWTGVHSVDHSPACDAGSSHHADQQSADAVTTQRAPLPGLAQLSDDESWRPESHQLKVSFSSSADEQRSQPNGRAILLHLSISRT